MVAKRRGRRGHEKRYEYCSGSVYQGPSVKKISGGDYPVRVGRLRAVHAPAVDALPTAIVKARTGWKSIKLDTGAQYSVASEAWKEEGVLQQVLPPVDYIEGFTGAVARALGVRRFKFLTQYGQEMEVDALVVEGAADEFLLG
ncbi:RNA-dependent DNA polymerase [Phytophthora cinnamomi]|uniref:RNA-dependent DNA polymerase n=1 Tax=Phytophthora cinnamomi TaxID=4785 RepID=UPI00355A0AC6|nr:RNA-dependent DNA polymerase [Phytophthora cinnamomi]